MLSYADVCCRMQEGVYQAAGVPSDRNGKGVCCRMLTYADVRRRACTRRQVYLVIETAEALSTCDRYIHGGGSIYI